MNDYLSLFFFLFASYHYFCVYSSIVIVIALCSVDRQSIITFFFILPSSLIYTTIFIFFFFRSLSSLFCCSFCVDIFQNQIYRKICRKNNWRQIVIIFSDRGCARVRTYPKHVFHHVFFSFFFFHRKSLFIHRRLDINKKKKKRAQSKGDLEKIGESFFVSSSKVGNRRTQMKRKLKIAFSRFSLAFSYQTATVFHLRFLFFLFIFAMLLAKNWDPFFMFSVRRKIHLVCVSSLFDLTICNCQSFVHQWKERMRAGRSLKNCNIGTNDVLWTKSFSSAFSSLLCSLHLVFDSNFSVSGLYQHEQWAYTHVS